jgi:membrane fusion protein (multidrug efflux system)
MNRRIAAIFAALIIVSGIVLGAILSNQKKPVRRRQRPQQKEQIGTMAVESGDIRTTVTITGPLAALDRVDVYAEVSGVLLPTGKRFRPGNRFEKGEPLIRIDDSVYRNNLLAQKSGLLNTLTLLLPDLSIDFPESEDRWRAYLERFDLHRSLSPLPETGSEKERYYIASRDVYSQFYTIKGMEATHEKYTIRAPYGGVVTASEINPGTLVRQGQKLGEFASTDTYEMEAFADLEEVRLLRVGMPAGLTCDDLPGTFRGTVSRINEVIDKHTQLVGVYITTTDEHLRDGLYMTASITSDPIIDAARIPRSSLVENGRVWVVRDSMLVLQEVEIEATEDGEIVVRGLSDGTVLVTEPPADVFEGMRLHAAGDISPASVQSMEGRHGH